MVSRFDVTSRGARDTAHHTALHAACADGREAREGGNASRCAAWTDVRLVHGRIPRFAAGIPPHHLKEPGHPGRAPPGDDGRGRRVTDPFISGGSGVATACTIGRPVRCNCMECIEDRAPEGLCQRPRSPVIGILHLRDPGPPAVWSCRARAERAPGAGWREGFSASSRRWTNPERLPSSTASSGPN